MFKKRIVSMSTFIKYLISYVMAIVLPVSIFMLITVNYYVGVIEQEAKHSNLSTLNQLQKGIDNNIENLHMIAMQIYNSPSFSYFNVNQNVISTSSAMTMLRGYLAGTKFISGIGVYYTQAGSGKVYSNYRVYSLQEFADSYYKGKYTDASLDRFLRTCNSNTLNVNINEDKSRSVTYVVPSNNPSISDRIVIFIIDNAYLEDVIGASKDFVFLKDKDKNIFTTANTNNKISNEISSKLFTTVKRNAVETIKLPDGEYLASCITSDTTGWSYMLVRPMMQALSNVLIMKKIAYYILIGMTIFLFATVLFFSRWSTKPFRKLLNFTEGVAGEENGEGSEIDKIYRRINRISNMNRELSETAKNNSTAVKEFILSSLIKGSFRDINEFNEKCANINVRYSLPNYRVAVVQISGNSGLSQQNCQDSIRLVEDSAGAGLQIFGCTQIENNRLVFISACENTEDKILQEFFSQIISQMCLNLDVYITIGIGSAYSQIDMIGKSYIEAITAVDYRLVRGRNTVIFYDNEGMSQFTLTNYPAKDLKHLEDAILAGNIEKIDESIGNLINIMKTKNVTLSEARCLCFDIINTIIKSIYAIKEGSEKIDPKYFNVMDLTSFETLEELQQALTKTGVDVCNIISERRMNKSTETIDRIMAYIKENYQYFGFSVYEMSSHFNMQVSSISRLFKKHTGENISDYVTKLRIEKSKELLNTTELSVNDIVSQVGYCDTSSFVRKFKKETGTTPGLYRKGCQ